MLREGSSIGPRSRLVPVVDLWEWQLRAAWRDGDSAVFFADYGEREGRRSVRYSRAKAICSGCPVRQECLCHALAFDERFGVWGGLTPSERVRLHGQ